MFDESADAAWQARYGAARPLDCPDLSLFWRHRSVRRFSDRPVPESLVASLVAAAQSAATSSHLQAYSLISVQESERRERIAHLCGDQRQVRTAPWFIAFVADLNRHAAVAEDVPDGIDTTEMFLVAAIDAALAAERMVCAAESVGLGICYIGALRNQPQEVAQTLSLPPRVFGVFGLCLGYPTEDGNEAIKPRLRQSEIWHRETYNATPDNREFDGRMTGFYESQGQNSEFTWTQRSHRRLQRDGLSGRETLRQDLAELGFPLD